MCGIFGNTAGLSRAPASRTALDRLSHRGPDQWGEEVRENLYLGHRRLSILDLSEAGRQPMKDAEGRVFVTVNGEIYNFQKLREELEREGCVFRSKSDSEVVIHGYLMWGLDRLLERIDGMYAFALADLKQGRVFLVRDRYGIKPLFYGMVGGELIWASELKAIASFCRGNLRQDETALYDFYTYRYIPAPKTIYKDVWKLPQGCYYEWNLEARAGRIARYWELQPAEKMTSLGQAAEELRVLLTESVAEQMISDVPLGFFLSGGLDSSSVVACARARSDKVCTFSIGFDEEGYSELPYARQVADVLKTDHHEKILGCEEVVERFSDIKEFYDEPHADTSIFPTHLVSALSREKVTVVLTGDGGDELFGGYTWHAKFAEELNGSSGGWTRLFKRANSVDAELEQYVRLLAGRPRRDRRRIAKTLGVADDYDDYWAFRRFYRRELPARTRAQFLDFNTYLPDDIFVKVDRASMAVSLEARVPFLKKELVEFAFSLPESVRFANGESKGVLKKAMEGMLPETILHRHKQGFSVPRKTWNRRLLAPGADMLDKIAGLFREPSAQNA